MMNRLRHLPINSHWLLWLLVGLTLTAGFLVRLTELQNPPLDFHPTRQLRTLIIARAAWMQMDPAADPAVRELALSLANLETYEPPILENLIAVLYRIIGSEVFWVGRVLNSLFWTVGGLFLFLLGRRIAGSGWAALAGLVFFMCLSFGVIASRSLQPEPWLVMWLVLFAWALHRWGEQPTWRRAITSGLLGGAAVLIKVIAAFFVAPSLVGIALASFGWWRFWRSSQFWVIATLAILPVTLYYLLAQGERSSDFFSFWVVSLSGLLLETNFYADWLAMIKSLTGLTICLLALAGVALAAPRARGLLAGLWLGYLVYGLFFPYQYRTHEYYHLPLLALIGLSVIPAADALLERLRAQPRIWRVGLGAAVAFAGFYSLYAARSTLLAADFSNEPASWRRVGEALPLDARFVALTGDYGMRLRYYGWRAPAVTWPSGADLDLARQAGADAYDFQATFDQLINGMDVFLVTALGEFDAQPDLKTALTENHPLAVEGNGFLIFDLRVGR